MTVHENKLIIDTGIFLALASSKDKHHKKALKLLKQTEKKDWITTWPVVVEASYLIGRISIFEAVKLIELYYQGSFLIYDLKIEHMPRLQELMLKYKDLPMDLADASLVILAEHLGHGRIASTDQRDFQTFRWKNNHPFENLFH